VNRDETLRLLIIDESSNAAEALSASLRNSGFAVRFTLAEDDEDLEAALKKQTVDMVLCAASLELISVARAAEVIAESDHDLPLLAVTHLHNTEALIKALNDGARDLIDLNQDAHLPLVVEREYDNMMLRRELASVRKGYAESEKRCRSLIDTSRDAITYVHEGMHIYANSVYLSMFGFEDREEIEGTPIMDMVAPEDHAKLKEFLRSYSKKNDDEASLEVRGLRPDGSHFNALMEFSPASIDGERCTQIIIRDQSSSKELEKKLKHLSKQDLLTGLYNRQYFIGELDERISAIDSTRQPLSVLYILLDNFKSIKDTVGIAGSDLVLGDIANLVRDRLGENDIAARFTDNAFTVMTCDHHAGVEIAGNIRKAVEDHIADVGGQSVTTTCSIGISHASDSGTNAHDVLTQADLACDIARTSGGNKVHVHDPVADAAADQDKEAKWTEMIRYALDNDRFHLVYQPIVSLQGSPGEKYEVLLRMVDNDNNEILPDQFIGIAEQRNLINAIDRWVISEAIRVLAEHRRNHGRSAVFFVKVSGPSLADQTLLPWVSERLKAARLTGDSLIFEISEESAVTYLKDAKAFAASIKELRCGIAIEHFGIRDNPFHIFKHISADYIKIDGSLMHKLAGNAEHQELIKTIAETANGMNIVSIAAFVEDANSLSVLWQSGVKFIQGNFLQQPMETLAYEFAEESA
jgi:diguanylate cyclase (GGDEF)-like protein/PAS domain S-box-containing protein